jgi:hypothetical protein
MSSDSDETLSIESHVAPMRRPGIVVGSFLADICQQRILAPLLHGRDRLEAIVSIVSTDRQK